jgi:hypothetical protein
MFRRNGALAEPASRTDAPPRLAKGEKLFWFQRAGEGERWLGLCSCGGKFGRFGGISCGVCMCCVLGTMVESCACVPA